MSGRIFHWLAIATCAALILAGCSGQPVRDEISECNYPDSPSEEAPLWVCGGPVKGIAIGAVGSAEKTAAGLEFQKTMAAAVARDRLARAMQTTVETVVKQYAEANGVGDQEAVARLASSSTRQVSSETLVGSRIFRQLTSPTGVLYVLVGFDEAYAEQFTANALRRSMEQDESALQSIGRGKSAEEVARDMADTRF